MLGPLYGAMGPLYLHRGGSAYRNLIKSLGPVAYWRLGESSGTTAVDEMGSYNGTYQGGATLGQTGAIVNDGDKSVLFDGSSGYISLGASLTVGAGDWTIESWVKTSAASGYIFARERALAAAYQFRIVIGEIGSRRITLAFTDAAGAGPYFHSTGAIGQNVWSHIAVTRVGSVYKIYINGIQDGTQTIATVIDNSLSNYDSRFGARMAQTGGGATGFWNGSQDENAIYNRALTATEILNNYRTGAFGPAQTRIPGSVAAGTAFTHTANCVIEWTQTTLPVGGASRIKFGTVDVNNGWLGVIDGNGNFFLFEQVAGVLTQRAASGVLVLAGQRIVIIADGTTIRGYSNNVLRWTYSSATNFQTATNGQRNNVIASELGTVSDLIA